MPESPHDSCEQWQSPTLLRILRVDLFEIEIGQVHVTVRQYVHGENISPFVEANLEKLRSQIPVVPLTLGQRIGRVISRRDLQRSCGVHSIHIN